MPSALRSAEAEVVAERPKRADPAPAAASARGAGEKEVKAASGISQKGEAAPSMTCRIRRPVPDFKVMKPPRVASRISRRPPGM